MFEGNTLSENLELVGAILPYLSAFLHHLLLSFDLSLFCHNLNLSFLCHHLNRNDLLLLYFFCLVLIGVYRIVPCILQELCYQKSELTVL
jgi:hypothetical protein